jgi:hypothetical protein
MLAGATVILGQHQKTMLTFHTEALLQCCGPVCAQMCGFLVRLLMHLRGWLERPASVGLGPWLQCSNLCSHLLELPCIPLAVKIWWGFCP